MRRRLAVLAAALGSVGALAPLRLLGEEELYYGNALVPARTFVLIAMLAMAVPSVVAVVYGYGRLSQRWAVAAVVVFVAASILAAWGVFYLGYLAATVLGMSIAAGDPLPPPDPRDDRLARPMPRRPESER